MPWYRLTIFWHANIGSHKKKHKNDRCKSVICSIIMKSNLGPIIVVFQTFRGAILFVFGLNISDLYYLPSIQRCWMYALSILSFLILYSTLLDVCTMQSVPKYVIMHLGWVYSPLMNISQSRHPKGHQDVDNHKTKMPEESKMPTGRINRVSFYITVCI